MRKNQFLTSLVFLLTFSTSFAQSNFSISQNIAETSTYSGRELLTQGDNQEIRRFRIGGKLGVPNLIGGNLEFVTPLMENKLAVSLDYSGMKGSFNDLFNEGEKVDVRFRYITGGVNYYFFRPASGLYGGLGYSKIGIKGDVMIPSEDPSGEPETGIVNFAHHSLYMKLGAKLGGLFYFRPELGFSFSALPTSIKYTRTTGNQPEDDQEIDFDSASYLSPLFSGIIFNFGIGFAF